MKITKRGFSLVELMVVLVLTSILVSSLYAYLNKARRTTTTQRLRANIETLTQISFFVMGRDIRRAGSNPAGAVGYSVGAGIPLLQATQTRIEILADLNGDTIIGDGTPAPTEEDVTYEFIDDPGNPDGIPDQIRRQAGNELVIENVQQFDLSYQMASGLWETAPVSTALIRKVRMHLVAGTGRIDPNTGVEDTKEVQMDILLRNFR